MNTDSPFVHQASAVAIGGRALLIEGPPGSGKSSLALALIDRGAGLIGDDAVTLMRTGIRTAPQVGTHISDVLMASPPPNIAGLIELRGIGIVQVPVAAPAPVALVLELGAARDTTLGERLPETPLPRRVIGGVAVPVLRFDPGTIAPAQRAEWALALHGTNANPPSLSAAPAQE
ncbi:HPr kinase/phosphorylase [Erythrobacter sanguineus]|uniref:Hpr(Ser) kinase/phosphatase n=1 Tax=Erythrobacter sanguineus TaxID=198312 RepID=A0A1M7RPQ9_9SPHN|nr:serine kinase [Erythrobacter sanguineus]SHN48357.1 Hpr(Ser) kinase/phosphatase [Erythrobacter sanguineus]